MNSEPGFPVFREAVSAIDRPALCWLEGDFALFSTVFVISLGPKFLGPPKLFLSIVLLMQL
jgi:hypothetical protein